MTKDKLENKDFENPVNELNSIIEHKFVELNLPVSHFRLDGAGIRCIFNKVNSPDNYAAHLEFQLRIWLSPKMFEVAKMYTLTEESIASLFPHHKHTYRKLRLIHDTMGEYGNKEDIVEINISWGNVNKVLESVDKFFEELQLTKDVFALQQLVKGMLDDGQPIYSGEFKGAKDFLHQIVIDLTEKKVDKKMEDKEK